MNTHPQSGFTLWELLVTIMVAGILMSLGIPSFLEYQRNNAMTAASNTLVTAVLAARSEAVKRQLPVTLCASPNPTAANPACSQTGAGTSGGYIVWVDENGNVDADGVPVLTDATDANAVLDAGELLLFSYEEPAGQMNVWGDSGYVTYAPSGFARNATGAAVPRATRVLFCDDRGNRLANGRSSARGVRIDVTGRGQVQAEIGDIANALAIINAAGVPAACP